MGAFDAAGFLISLLSMSLSVSLLLGGLALFKERLLTRYRARTLYLLGLLLTALLLCPWRPALLMPKITLPAVQVVEAATLTEDTSLTSTQNPQPSGGAAASAAMGQAAGVSAGAAASKASGDTSQRAVSSTHQTPIFSWTWALFAVWVAGILAVILFQTTRHACFLRLIRRWQSPVCEDVHTALAAQCARLGIRPPPAYVTPCVQSPTVAGIMHPMILLPATQYNRQQLSLMLTHELIHLKHGHLWGKALGCLALAVHWFNPLMPFLMRETGALCEMACDEAVLTRHAPEQQGAYVDAIVHAALRIQAVRTPLCSPLNGGVKQMNQIKHRITLLTPFRPRRAGAGFIALMLLLALFTGSVLAERLPVSTFAIPQSDWLTPVSQYMPQADYDLVMSMQTPGWEELSTQAYAKQITPQLPVLTAAFNNRWPENRFMRHLKYSVEEASNPSGDSYQVPWNTQFWWAGLPGGILLTYELNWQYLSGKILTCAQRSKLLDDALAYADRTMRELIVPQMQEAANPKGSSTALAAQLNETAKKIGGNTLSIWFTNVDVDTSLPEISPDIQKQQELLSPLTPEGYLDQTAADYQLFLQEYEKRFDPKVKVAMESRANITVNEAYLELHGYTSYLNKIDVNLSLMPAWTMRGRISYTYQLDWKTVDPSRITVGQRHDAIRKLFLDITKAAAKAVWEAQDWESLDKTLKERLPMLAQAESTPALTFTVSGVKLEVQPLATEKYVHSSPQSVLKAFMTAASDQDTALMAATLPPIEADIMNAQALATRESKLKSFVNLMSSYWTLGEAWKVPGKEDAVIIELTFYKFNSGGSGDPQLVNRQARLTQIDGKWYLLLESLQL